GEVELLAGLAGVHPADHARARPQHPLGVPGALSAGDALDDDLAVLVEEDCHDLLSSLPGRGELGGATGRAVHGVDLLEVDGSCAGDEISEDPPALLG